MATPEMKADPLYNKAVEAFFNYVPENADFRTWKDLGYFLKDPKIKPFLDKYQETIISQGGPRLFDPKSRPPEPDVITPDLRKKLTSPKGTGIKIGAVKRAFEDEIAKQEYYRGYNSNIKTLYKQLWRVPSASPKKERVIELLQGNPAALELLGGRIGKYLIPEVQPEPAADVEPSASPAPPVPPQIQAARSAQANKLEAQFRQEHRIRGWALPKTAEGKTDTAKLLGQEWVVLGYTKNPQRVQSQLYNSLNKQLYAQTYSDGAISKPTLIGNREKYNEAQTEYSPETYAIAKKKLGGYDKAIKLGAIKREKQMKAQMEALKK